MSQFGYLKNEQQMGNWLRSSLRRVWSKHPVKLVMLQKARYKHLMGNRVVFCITCERCKQPTKQGDIEVNHRHQAGSFSLETFGAWVQRLLIVKEEELELLCKDCHGVQTYSERYNVNLVEAQIQKYRVTFSKLPLPEQDAQLASFGISIEKPTAKKRADAYVEHLRKGTL